MKHTKAPQILDQSYPFSAASIDHASEAVYTCLTASGKERKNAMRFRLSLEEILLTWQQSMGEDASFTVICRKRFGQPTVQLKCKGQQINPLQQEALTGDEADLTQRSILSGLGVFTSFRYVNGVNCVSLRLQKADSSALRNIALALVMAVVCGGLCQLLPENVSAFIGGEVLAPLADTFMRALKLVSGPLIFLSLVIGVINIGDKASLGKLGGALLKAALLGVTLMALIPLALTLPSLNFASATAEVGGSAFSELYTMILDAIPSDLFSPFVSGNSLQIIVIAVLLGFAILAVCSKNGAFTEVLMEVNGAVQFIMAQISKLLPLFIFVSVFNMMLDGSMSDALQSYMLIVYTVVSSLVIMALYIAAVCVKHKVSPLTLLRKELPTLVIGLTTASSSAAFATNMETCVKKLGIAQSAVNFAIPMGQVIFMPGCMVSFLLSGLFTVMVHGTPVSASWLLMAVIITVILAIAAPPIPGGGLTCCTILFTQLALSMSYLPVIMSISMLTEFVVTAVNLFCLQNQLILIAGKSGLLDAETLKNP